MTVAISFNSLTDIPSCSKEWLFLCDLFLVQVPSSLTGFKKTVSLLRGMFDASGRILRLSR